MALLAVAGVQARYHQAVTKDSMRLRARALAASLMDRAEARLRDNFDLDVTEPRGPGGLDSQGVYETSVEQRLLPEDENLKRVEVAVFWEDRQGPQSLRLWCVFLRGE